MDEKLSAAIAILAVLAASFLFIENSFLKSQLSENKAKLETQGGELRNANGEISRLNIALEEKNGELARTRISLEAAQIELFSTRQKLSGTESELGKASGKLVETKAELEQLSTQISKVEDSINVSIQWFRDNSQLPPTLGNFVLEAQAKCIIGQKLKLPCVSFLLEKTLGFEYKNESQDRLYSIKEMVAKKGGDCEDYSLFLKAFLKSISSDKKGLQLESWEPGAGKYTIYETSREYWYYGNSQAHYAGSLDELNPYAICYTTKLNGNILEGHCTVALSKNRIASIADIPKLKGAETFEPQDGKYMGKIGEEFGVCREGEKGCDRGIGQISFVITEDDLYHFDSLDGEWNSYNAYSQVAAGLQKNVITG